MAEMNVRDLMGKIPGLFKPEKAKGVSAIVQCIFSGNQASDWVIRIEDQTCTVEERLVGNPDITIKPKGEDGVKLLTGRMNPVRAYMLRKVKISGDLSLGKELVEFFK